MLANVEISKGNVSCDNCFKICVKDNTLVMNYISGAIKNSFNIPISEMTNLTTAHWFGSQQINFSYQNLKFEFIENGYGEIDYLKKNLCQSVQSK